MSGNPNHGSIQDNRNSRNAARRRPRITPNVLFYTLLGPPELPDLFPTPYQRRQQQRWEELLQRMRNAEEEERERREEEERMDREDQIYRDQADDISDALNRHHGLQAGVRAEFMNAFLHLREEGRENHNKKELYLGFVEHSERTKLVSGAAVRKWDILSWFRKDLPRHCLMTVDKIKAHHHREAELRHLLHELEMKIARRSHDQCLRTDFCRREDEYYARSEAIFQLGFGIEYERNGFGDYTRILSSEADLQHLHASFLTRKRCLEDAAARLRNGFERGWDDSLDGRMASFIETARAGINVGTTQQQIRNKFGSSTDDRDEARKTAKSKRAAEILLEMSDHLLKEMRTYLDGLIRRNEKIRERNVTS